MTLAEMLVLAAVIFALGWLAKDHHDRWYQPTEHAVHRHPANRIRLIQPVYDWQERNIL